MLMMVEGAVLMLFGLIEKILYLTEVDNQFKIDYLAHLSFPGSDVCFVLGLPRQTVSRA
jgi:hypothetical protein